MDAIVSAMACQITSVPIVHFIVCPGADKKKSKLHVTGLCEGNSPVSSEFPAQRASNAKNVSIWWYDDTNDNLLSIEPLWIIFSKEFNQNMNTFSQERTFKNVRKVVQVSMRKRALALPI